MYEMVKLCCYLYFTKIKRKTFAKQEVSNVIYYSNYDMNNYYDMKRTRSHARHDALQLPRQEREYDTGGAGWVGGAGAQDNLHKHGRI